MGRHVHLSLVVETFSINLSIGDQGTLAVGSAEVRCLSNLDDEVLVSAAKAGDTDGFAELYRRQSRRVLPKTCRVTKNREDAEDTSQDAIVKAFAHFNSFEGRSIFTSWRTRIAANSALVMLRRRRGGGGVSGTGTLMILKASVHGSRGIRERRRRSAACDAKMHNSCGTQIGHLPCRCRRPVELRYLQNYSTAQVTPPISRR